MQYRRLGTSGLQLSALSFGAWLTFGKQIDRNRARELVAMAWDHGINFFDNAEAYANGEAERVMGDVIADLRLPRDGFCVSSKVMFGSAENPRPTQRGLSRKHVLEACDAALKRLRVDHLDLYFCHRPDPDTPIAETVAAMDTLVRQGKVLYWGTSEWPADMIREAARIARDRHQQPPSMEQPQYNLLCRERVEVEYESLYSELGLGTTAWSPLASGLLTGKHGDGLLEGTRLGGEAPEFVKRQALGQAAERRLERVERFVAVATELGEKPAVLAIAWCLRNPHVSSVILGASKTSQLLENLGALEWLERDDASIWKRIEAAIM